MCTQATGFLRFLCLEFVPGLFRENSLEAPRSSQKASRQMGCNSMPWCERAGGHGCSACRGPDASPRWRCSSAAAMLLGPPCPARAVLPEKLSLPPAIDLAKRCCKWSLMEWSVIRMRLRFIEVPFLKGQGYLSEFSGSPFAWQQDCADPQSLPFYFSCSKLFSSWRLEGQSPPKQRPSSEVKKAQNTN